MRIITGSARGIQLQTLEGMLVTRPTTDRVKEALFSMLQFDIEGRKVLDLFAGSGQLGLEALSRGAAKAVFIDSSREAVDIILKNAAKTRLKDRCSVSATDFKGYLASASGREKFDIIFLDPPYNSEYMAEALELIEKNGILALNGVVVCETDTEEEERRKNKKAPKTDDLSAVLNDVFHSNSELMDKYYVRKTVRYGRTRVTLLEIAD